MCDSVSGAPWTRKHDDPRVSLIDAAPRIVYPTTLKELIGLCRDRPQGERLKPAGSHWALSFAALSDHTFIETHDPQERRPAMGRTLTEVVPGCMDDDLLQNMAAEFWPERGLFAHVEAGKRIYQLYAELDTPQVIAGEGSLARLLKDRGNAEYERRWAFSTLGGAGGQTVVGAFSTGTHGGDFTLPPLADSVVALHLVTDGGRHLWIESVDDRHGPRLTDDDKLMALYGREELGGPGNFEIIRDNAVFDAVLVGAGRFGVIYSAVVRARPQYALRERRRLHLWQDVRDQIAQLDGPLFSEPAVPGVATRFLQIAVCLTPHANMQQNLAGVTKRWEVPLTSVIPGREERVGAVLGEADDPLIGAPRFERAGRAHAYTPHPDRPHAAADPGMLERACADPSFLRGILGEAIRQVEEFVESNGAVVGAGVAGVAAVGGLGLLALIPFLLLVVVVLRELLDAFDDDTRFGEHMETIKNGVLVPGEPDPMTRAAGIFAWQLIAFLAFQSQQDDREYEAVSYAVMDQKDYLNVSCEANVDSVEVFFDAVDDRLVAFVDALIAYEAAQELEGLAFVGYASLRFMGPTRATIGMQKHAVTCAVEVACLRDVTGSQALIDHAVRIALDPAFGGVLHWGQRNDAEARHIERQFGDPLSPTNGDLGAWRAVLARLTDGGARDGFSSAFTRRTGLEVV